MNKGVEFLERRHRNGLELVTREMLLTITVTYYFIPIRMTLLTIIVVKTENNK